MSKLQRCLYAAEIQWMFPGVKGCFHLYSSPYIPGFVLEIYNSREPHWGGGGLLSQWLDYPRSLSAGNQMNGLNQLPKIVFVPKVRAAVGSHKLTDLHLLFILQLIELLPRGKLRL